MLGMLGGLAEAAEGRHELVHFAPTGPAQRPTDCAAALDGIPGRAPPDRHPAALERLAKALESQAARSRSSCLAGAARRLPFLGLDVPAAARRAADDDDPRPAAAPPPRVGRPADDGAARPEVLARGGDLRSDLRELAASLRTTSSERLASRASGSSSRTPGFTSGSGRRAGGATSARRTCSPRQRSSRARTSKRCSRPSPSCGPIGRSSSSPLPDRARRFEARVCERLGMSGTRSCRRCTEARRLSSSRRSSRASGSRSWRRWRQERRPSPPRIRRWTRRAVTRRYGSIPRSPEAIAARHRAGACPTRGARAARARACSAVHVAGLRRGDAPRVRRPPWRIADHASRLRRLADFSRMTSQKLARRVRFLTMSHSRCRPSRR